MMILEQARLLNHLHISFRLAEFPDLVQKILSDLISEQSRIFLNSSLKLDTHKSKRSHFGDCALAESVELWPHLAAGHGLRGVQAQRGAVSGRALVLRVVKPRVQHDDILKVSVIHL